MEDVDHRRAPVARFALVVAAFLVFGCDDFALADLFYRQTDLPLAIYPAVVAVAAGGTVEFAATGGAPGYSFRVVEPGGGTIDANGTYTAPGVAGEFTVEVTDQLGDVSMGIAYVVVQQALRIEPTSATVGFGEKQSFAAIGGTAPYQFGFDGDVGTIDESGGEFTAHEITGYGFVALTDANGAYVTAVVYVTDDTTLMLTADRNPIQQDDDVGITTYGGSGGYNYITELVSEPPPPYDDGPGRLPAPYNRYYADDSIGTVRISVTDDAHDTYALDLDVRAAAPTGFSASGATGSPRSIKLVWTHDHPGHSGFRIVRSTSGGPYVEIATLDPDAREYVDTECSPNTPYEYQIYTTVDAAGGRYESRPAGPVFSVSNP